MSVLITLQMILLVIHQEQHGNTSVVYCCGKGSPANECLAPEGGDPAQEGSSVKSKLGGGKALQSKMLRNWAEWWKKQSHPKKPSFSPSIKAIPAWWLSSNPTMFRNSGWRSCAARGLLFTHRASFSASNQLSTSTAVIKRKPNSQTEHLQANVLTEIRQKKAL